MKTTAISATFVALVSLAAAQPHGRHHLHRRDPVKEVVVLEQNGKIISTYTTDTAGPTAAPAAGAAKKVQYQAPAGGSSSTSSTSSSTSASATPSSSSGSQGGYGGNQGGNQGGDQGGNQGGSANGNGISYSPYNSDGSCKSGDQVKSDMSKFDGYGFVRIYGTDCDQVSNVYNVAKDKGLKMFIGMANQKILSGNSVNTGAVSSECDAIAKGVNSDWSVVHTVSVGNELVNQGVDSGSVASAIGGARSTLKSKGYSGPVVSADTFVAMINNPEVCQASDYAAANCHPFFDGGVTADQAGDWVLKQSKNVADKCGGKKVIITETGWPTQGGSNGVAQPSKQNQQTVISGIKKAFSSNPAGVILFTAYNDMWKQDSADTHGCEKYWGIMD